MKACGWPPACLSGYAHIRIAVYCSKRKLWFLHGIHFSVEELLGKVECSSNRDEGKVQAIPELLCHEQAVRVGIDDHNFARKALSSCEEELIHAVVPAFNAADGTAKVQNCLRVPFFPMVKERLCEPFKIHGVSMRIIERKDRLIERASFNNLWLHFRDALSVEAL